MNFMASPLAFHPTKFLPINSPKAATTFFYKKPKGESKGEMHLEVSNCLVRKERVMEIQHIFQHLSLIGVPVLELCAYKDYLGLNNQEHHWWWIFLFPLYRMPIITWVLSGRVNIHPRSGSFQILSSKYFQIPNTVFSWSRCFQLNRSKKWQLIV